MSSARIERPSLSIRELPAAVEVVVRWFPIVILLGLWELASGWVVGTQVLPPPSMVLVTLAGMLVESLWPFRLGSVIPDLLISLYRVVWGLGLSIAAGVLLGIGMGRSDSIENFFDVFLALLYPVPKTALVPLAILWLGRGTETAVLIIFLACLLPIVLNSYNAARQVDQRLIWSARMMGTSDRDIFRKVVIPDTVPQIITGIRQAIPIAFIALTGAELIGASDGMGAIVLQAGQLGTYSRMFAAVVIISSVSYGALRGFDTLEQRVIVWT